MKSLLLILLTMQILISEDSLRIFRMNDIIVTGTRTAVVIEKLPSSVLVIDSADIKQSNGVSVADIIRHSSGLSIRSYGGNGALQSLSVRGLGSDYSLVLVDGQRYTLHQISTVDLGMLSLYDIDRIEIANGGNSSTYGANAIGGVINIITKKPHGNISAVIGITVGSYGLNGYALSTGGGNDFISYRASMQLLQSPNEFDFKYSDGRENRSLQRSGSDYNIKNYAVTVRNIFTENVVSTYSARYTDARRGQPSAVTSAVQNNLARIDDKDIFLSFSTEYGLTEQINLSLPITYHGNHQIYSDPNLVLNNSPLSSTYKNTLFSFSPIFRYSFSNELNINGGTDISVATITSNEVHPARREQAGFFLASHHTFFLPFEVLVYPSLRYDYFSDTESDLSSKIGLNIGILQEPVLRFRSSIGKNFRVPTFNDLYWIDGGNPFLRPERALNFDAGIIIGFEKPNFNIYTELNYFSIETSDKIVWLPTGSLYWSPKNLQSVSSTGMEISVKVNAFENLLMLNYHHNFTKTIKTSADIPNDDTQNKILPFVPQEISTMIIGTSYAGVSANVLYSFTGYRFETSDNNPRFVLPNYETVGMNISLQTKLWRTSLKIKGEVNNITNTSYYIISGYPIPLRNYLLTSEIAL